MTETISMLLWCVIGTSALVTFVVLQRYMNDPRRREISELWYAQFKANVERRYSEQQGLGWRTHDLHEMFHYSR